MHRECRDDGADTARRSARAAVGSADASPDVRVGVSAVPGGRSRDSHAGPGQGTAPERLASDARGAVPNRWPRAMATEAGLDTEAELIGASTRWRTASARNAGEEHANRDYGGPLRDGPAR